MPCTPNCGACCDPVTMSNAGVENLTDPVRNPEPASRAFILDNWAARGPTEDGRGVVFDCVKYDVQTRQCTAYDDRPPVCRNYPWYGGEPDNGIFNVCGYQAELGRTVLPLVSVT